MYPVARLRWRHFMKTKLTFLGLTWLGAFLVVMALFAVFGRTLQQWPLAVRALVISGVMTLSMSLVVAPGITRYLTRNAMREVDQPPAR